MAVFPNTKVCTYMPTSKFVKITRSLFFSILMIDELSLVKSMSKVIPMKFT